MIRNAEAVNVTSGRSNDSYNPGIPVQKMQLNKEIWIRRYTP